MTMTDKVTTFGDSLSWRTSKPGISDDRLGSAQQPRTAVNLPRSFVAGQPRLSRCAKRTGLSERHWRDLDRAAQIAGARNVRLIVHGIIVEAQVKQQQPQQQQQQSPHQPAQPTQPAQPAQSAQSLTMTGEPPAQPLSRRQQLSKKRSQSRLQLYNSKKRRQLISASPRVQIFLKQFRWNRMQKVWTAWMAAQQQEEQKQQQQQQKEQLPLPPTPLPPPRRPSPPLRTDPTHELRNDPNPEIRTGISEFKDSLHQLNPFRHRLRAALGALAMSDPSVTCDVHRGGRHVVIGVQAIKRNRTTLP